MKKKIAINITTVDGVCIPPMTEWGGAGSKAQSITTMSNTITPGKFHSSHFVMEYEEDLDKAVPTRV